MSDGDQGTAVTEAAPPAPRRRWMRAAWRWSVRLILVLALLGVAYVAWTNHRGTRAVTALRQALVDRGVPTDVAQWREQHFGALDPQRDGTHWVRAAIAASDTPHETQRDVPHLGDVDVNVPVPPWRIDDETAAAMAAYVQRQQPAFDLLERAREYDQFDFGLVDESHPQFLDLSFLGGSRALARSLQVLNLHAQATGDNELATQSALALLHLTFALEHEPMVLTELVRISIVALTIHVVEDMLSRMMLSDAQLEMIQSALADRRASGDLVRVMEGELAMGLAAAGDRDRLIFGRMAMRKAMRDVPDLWLPPLNAVWDDALERWSGPPIPDSLYRLWLALCPGRLELDAVDEAQTALDEYDELVRRGPVAEPDAPMQLTVLRIRAQLAVAEAALAIERFRRAHDRWPRDLDEVENAPALTLPLDPFTDEALRYAEREDGVVVYSIGDNLADDGGYGRSPEHPDVRDQVFRLYDPGVRNSAPPEPATTGDAAEPDEPAYEALEFSH